MSYAKRTRAPKRTMLDAEIAALLKVSGEHRDGFRDHVIFSLMLGAGLRGHEIAGLNLGDVTDDGERVFRSIRLRVFKRSKHGPTDATRQVVKLGDATYYKLEKYVRTWPHRFDLQAPLFQSNRKRRLSTRRIRSLTKLWQAQARIARPYSAHELRHTAISKYRERTGDIRKAQLFARHANITTTTIYDHPSDQELLSSAKEQPG